MSAVSPRTCIVIAALFVVLSGCESVDEVEGAKEQATKTETPSEPGAQSAAVPTTEPVVESSTGLGPSGLLEPLADRDAPTPNALAVIGPIFNGPYSVELGAADRRRAREAIHTALEWLPVGQLKVWRNPDNGHWGTVTATRTYQNADGAWCRDYRQTVTIGGEENQDSGAACRNPVGVWQSTG